MKTQNIVVGAKVTLDFGNLWRGYRPEYQERERVKAAAENEHYYGRKGVVIDYDREDQKILVRMDDDGTTDWHYRGSANIEELPQNKTDALLSQILEVLKARL